MARSREQLSVDVKLRCFIDAAGNCKDRQFFYNLLKSDGPEVAFARYSKRVGINSLWLPTILSILTEGDSQ